MGWDIELQFAWQTGWFFIFSSLKEETRKIFLFRGVLFLFSLFSFMWLDVVKKGCCFLGVCN